MSGFRSLRLPARHALASCECHSAYTRDVLSLSLPGKVSQLPPQAGSRTPVDQKHPLPPNRLTDASHSSLTGLRQNLQEFFGLLAVDIGRPRFEPSCLVVLRVPHGRPTPKAGSTCAISVKSPPGPLPRKGPVHSRDQETHWAPISHYEMVAISQRNR